MLTVPERIPGLAPDHQDLRIRRAFAHQNDGCRWPRFFLAEMPPGQDAQHDGSEVTDSCWMTAADVLSVGKKGGMNLPFPTRTNLKRISEFRTVDDLLSWASAQAAEGIAKIRPVILRDNGKIRFVIPGDRDYPEDGDQ